jgi:hypothetical protein
MGGALIVLGACFATPAIGQRLAVSGVTPRPVTPRGDRWPTRDSVALARLDDHHVGDAVRVSVLRESRKVEVTVTLVGGAS